ncbi:MAG: antibiotic biosynthesis monooxygenase [Acidimicrobiia bacterium]|nr:antibiotic biosynthesis monooxygenase [Acidimicrobiia bacterium]
MIVVAGTITFDPADHEGVRRAVMDVAGETRKEAGNLSYEFFADLSGPGRMLVFEEWESDDALQAHFGAPHMLAYRAALENFDMRSRSIKRYVVTETSNL